MSDSTDRLDLDDWIDRDLSAAVMQDALAPVFAVDEDIEQAEELVRSGTGRHPVWVGPPGIGRTARVHGLLLRAHAGTGLAELADARVVQLSLRSIRSRFKSADAAQNCLRDLLDLIVSSPSPIVPFISDLHVAYHLDWESVLLRFLERHRHPVLAVGLQTDVVEMLEYASELEGHLYLLPVREPDLAQTNEIAESWVDWRVRRGHSEVQGEAVRYALELTARFMGDRPFPRKVLDVLARAQDRRLPERSTVSVSDVVACFSQSTRVPAHLIDPRESLDLAEVRSFVGERLLGQDEAVDAVVRMFALIKAGLADLRRPFGAFLFVGPTGVGKTHCAQLLAEYLFGRVDGLIRLNMADYASPEDALTLFGSPTHHKPRGQRGELATRLRGHPFGVLLLDEFEKAHGLVHDRFLQLLDEGCFINGRGEQISVTSLIIVATSNAGADVYRGQGLGFDARRNGAQKRVDIDRRISETFRYELLNRFDRVVHFHPLGREHIRAIARRELRMLGRREGLRTRKLALEVDSEVLDWLVSSGYHPEYGARFLRREIERSVAAAVAEFIVRESPERGSRLSVQVRRGRVRVELARPPMPVVMNDGSGSPIQLTRGQLLDEAATWLSRFDGLEEGHRERQARAQRLMDTSSGRGFWDDPAHAEDVLRRFKRLDARLVAERRLLRPVEKLRSVVGLAEESMSVDLGAHVQEVMVAHHRWMDLDVEDAPVGVWLMLGPADALGVSSEWLVDLVGMYRAWFRRNNFTYDLVGEEVLGGEVTRVVFEVEGARVHSILSMEDGEHRRMGPSGLERLRVWVLPRRDAPVLEDIPGGEVSDAKRGRGVALARRVARLTLRAPRRGVEMVLHGNSRQTLSLLGADLGGILTSPDNSGDVVREYGLNGGAVQDPRTSASVAQIKGVLRGELEAFLRAWEAR